MSRRLVPGLIGLALVLAGAGCGAGHSADAGTGTDGGSQLESDGGADAGVPVDAGVSPVRISITSVDTRFTTREHFLAGYEMQLSGEPLAEAIGRDLRGYERDYLPTNYYFLNGTLEHLVDPLGFSLAVESYEYSKQPMNNVALESGAGTSLVFGPLENPDGGDTSAEVSSLAGRLLALAKASNAYGFAVRDPGSWRGGSPNPLAYPGLWPTVHVFRSFDPAVNPVSSVDLSCSITSDNDSTGDTVADYECDATSLWLPSRDTQVEKVITPGADGFSALKYGLWIINYLQVMHDTSGNFVSTVDAGELAQVGTPQNAVVGEDGAGNQDFPGTYLGSSDLEGFQAGVFLEELNNRAEDWVRHLSTTDGTTLSGFASLQDALDYQEGSPLRWFPDVSVTETATAGGFPHPRYAVASADSDALDQAGLVAGFAEVYALTDHANDEVGGSQAARAYFDGAPFADDDQLADGEPTLHDRALAVIRVSLLDLDRLHRDPATGYLVDSVHLAGATPTRGGTVSTVYAAYELVSLRNVLRALSSQLKLYSNNSPDTAVAMTPLDTVPVGGSFGDATVSQRISALIRAQAELLYVHLTTADGRAFAGYDLHTGQPTDTGDTLDAHTAAVRGLFQAYLATGATKYRDRAVQVFTRLDSVFYDPGARLYTATPAPADGVDYTPLRFGLLQSNLRDMINLVGTRPGNDALETHLEARLERLNKLVLDGWDDANQDGRVDYPEECVQVRDGLPRGGLQMAERALTGEIGSLEEELDLGDPRTPTSDRDQDCVPEIDDAHLPSSLADSVHFTLSRP